MNPLGFRAQAKEREGPNEVNWVVYQKNALSSITFHHSPTIVFSGQVFLGTVSHHFTL